MSMDVGGKLRYNVLNLYLTLSLSPVGRAEG